MIPRGIAILEGEALIRDTDLAGKLGYEDPTQIRKLIKRNVAALKAMGPFVQNGRMVAIGSGALREVTEYHLNQAQAAYLFSKARTKNADSMAIVIAEVFALFASGHLAPTSEQAEAAVVDSLNRYREREEARREHREARREAFKVLNRSRPRRRRTLIASLS